MAEKFVDFKLVKERVSMEAALARYNIHLRQVNQHSIRGRCPLPSHSSEQSSESFIVQTIKNIWACQSHSCVAARQGKKGGNVLDFVALMERVTIREAALKLNDWFLGGSPTAPKVAEKGSTSTQELVSEKQSDDAGEVNVPLTFTLKNIDHAHPYLVQRGVTESIAKSFGVGFFSGRGSMSGRVVIPIHNRNGELVAYAGRAIDASEPRYKLPTGFRKSLELYNLHRAIAENNPRREVIIVEGFFACIAVSSAGFPCVALMGSSLSDVQEKILAETFSSAWLLFDGDDAGREATGECVARLARRMWVRTSELPNGTQPDQLLAERLKDFLKG